MSGSIGLLMQWSLKLWLPLHPAAVQLCHSRQAQAEVDDDPELLNSIKTTDAEAIRGALQKHVVCSGELLADHIDERISTTLMDVQFLS